VQCVVWHMQLPATLVCCYCAPYRDQNPDYNQLQLQPQQQCQQPPPQQQQCQQPQQQQQQQHPPPPQQQQQQWQQQQQQQSFKLKQAALRKPAVVAKDELWQLACSIAEVACSQMPVLPLRTSRLVGYEQQLSKLLTKLNEPTVKGLWLHGPGKHGQHIYE